MFTFSDTHAKIHKFSGMFSSSKRDLFSQIIQVIRRKWVVHSCSVLEPWYTIFWILLSSWMGFNSAVCLSQYTGDCCLEKWQSLIWMSNCCGHKGLYDISILEPWLPSDSLSRCPLLLSWIKLRLLLATACMCTFHFVFTKKERLQKTTF